MSKARQEDLNGAMVSILKKMDAMLDTINQTYQEQLLVLNRIDSVQTNVVAEELKKQTILLTSIEAKIASGGGGGGDGGGSGAGAADFAAFGAIGKVLQKLVKTTKRLDEGAGEKVKSFFTKLGEGIKAFTENVDEKKAKSIIELVSALARGIILFALAMIIATPLLVLALPGILLLGLSIRLLMSVIGKQGMSEEIALGIKAVLDLGKGAMLYAVSMVVVSLLSPAVLIGSLALGLSIRLLMVAAGTADKEGAKAMSAVLSLAKGAILYSLAMIVVTLLAPVVLIGSLVLGLSIRLLLFAAGTADKKGVSAMAGVLALAKGALLYSLAMILVTLLAPVVLIGSLVLGLSFRVIGWGFKSLSNKKILMGLVALGGIILGILLLAMTMAYFAKNVEWMDLLKVIATVGGLAIIFYIAGKFFTPIVKGALAMIVAGIALFIIVAAVAVFKGAGVTWEDLGMLAATVGGLALIGAIAGIGPIPLFIALGSAALIVAGIAVLLIATAMNVWMAAGVTMDDALVLGATIGMIGVEFALFGLASIFILLGAAAMIVVGVALLPITLGIVAFKASGFTKEDADTLEYTLGSVVAGFLGGRMPGGILAGIKFAAGAAARAALLFITAPPMILAGLALLPITASLLMFKKADFSTTDADNLEYMLGSIVKSFGIVTDYERQKKMGFYVNPFNLYLGIAALSGAGRVLAGLAEGVQAWANLEVNEWEVVNGGTADAKLVIKGRRKLNEGDFDAAAYGMAKVISAISKPFADVGKLEKGEPSGNPLLDAIFGGGFVSAGIDALARSGDTLVSLAQGVQAFANLEITTYEVVGAGTVDAKLVPKEKRKLSDPEIEAAGNNIAKILGVVAGAFADIGRQEKESSGWFSGGFVTKGVEALAGVGEILGGVTDGVLRMAYNEIPQFDLIGEGTKDAKLVPGKPLILKDSDLVAAGKNIGEILGVVANSIAEIGRLEAKSKGWFSDGYVGKGTVALAGVGDIVSKVADAVIKFATGEIPTFTLINEGKKDQALVPGMPKKLTSTMLKNAARTIGTILNIVGKQVALFGEYIEEREDSIKSASKNMAIITNVITQGADSLKTWSALENVDESVDKISRYFTSIRDMFDPTKNLTLPMSSYFFTKFATNIELVQKNASAFDKVAVNFDKIEKSMKLIGTHINGLDLKKLTLTDSMFKALAVMSKNPDAIAKMVGDTMAKSFEELIKALKELAESNTPEKSDGGSVMGSIGNALTPGFLKDKPAAAKPPPAPSKEQGVRINNIQELARAIAALQ